MAVQTDLYFETDLNRGLALIPLQAVFFTGDKESHRFIVAGNRDGQKESFSGATIKGYVIRPDGATVAIGGTVDSEGRAIISLLQQCYAVPGRFQVVIRATLGDVDSTIFAGEGRMQKSSTDIVVDPGSVTDLNAVLLKVEQMEEAVQNAGIETIPDYWLTHLKNRVQDIRSAMTAAGWNKSSFLWYNDSHWTYNYQKSPMLLKYLSDHTPINKTIFGGDIVDNEGDDTTTMAYLWNWRDAVREIPNHHSVPSNHDDGNTIDNRFTDQYIYAYLLAAEETPDVVRGDALYYYIDNPCEKTRYLYLDTATKDGNILNDAAQKAWLKQTLLSTPDNWHIVAIGHIWLSVNYDVNPPVATGFSMGGKIALDMFDAYNARSGDYASCTGRVEFCIGGHSHVDADYVSAGGIPVIITECDSRNIRSNLACTSGTITENSVNAVVASYDEGIVSVIRIGRGVSRTVKLDGSGSESSGGNSGEDSGEEETPVNYTNMLDVATDTDGSLYNGGTGYKANTRISTSSGVVEKTESPWCVTGYFPVKRGDVVRLKNITFYEPDNTSAYPRTGVYGFDSSYSLVTETSTMSHSNPLSATWNVVTDANGQVTQFTIPSSWDSESEVVLLRLCVYEINDTSVITVNEEIE